MNRAAASAVAAATGLGIGPYKVPLSLYAHNREKLIKRLAANPAVPKHAAAVFQGGQTAYRHDTDAEPLFRQESNFYYLFGLNEPDCYGALDVHQRQSLLFVPRRDPSYATWCGQPLTCAEYASRFGVDACHFVDDMVSVLRARGIESVLTLSGTNTDSGSQATPAAFEGKGQFAEDVQVLHGEIAECRVIKSAEEVDLLRYVCGLSAEAHRTVMRRVRPGMFEYQLESLFKHHCSYHGGSRYDAYTAICGCGEHGAVLHYGHAGAPNDGLISDGDMLLLDMGSEYQGYCSDITCSFPANGRFTDDQRAVYNAVLAAQRGVEAALRPGVRWVDMHFLAERAIIEGLVGLDLIRPQGRSLDSLQHELHLGAVFFPHGLGHFMGLDTHDVGGYPVGGDGPRPSRPGARSLRTNRVMQAGMVITVEPGCYFIPALIDAALADPAKAPHLNAEKLARFRNFGGIRLEDDVLVVQDGCEVLHSVPRTVEEIEALMAAGRAAE